MKGPEIHSPVGHGGRGITGFSDRILTKVLKFQSSADNHYFTGLFNTIQPTIDANGRSTVVSSHTRLPAGLLGLGIKADHNPIVRPEKN